MKWRLALPFAFVAAAPFVMFGRPIEALMAALSMGTAGYVMRRPVSWGGLGCATTVLGGIAGLCAGSFALGVLLGLAAVFPLRLIAWAAEGGSARRGSVLDGVDVRQAWGVAGVLVTIVPSPLLSIAPDLPGLTLVFAGGACVLLAVAVADLRDFRALAQLAAHDGEEVPLRPVARSVPVVDAGVGERQKETRLPGSPYRGGEELLFVARGDASEARRRLITRLILDVGLIFFAALLFKVSQT